MTNLIYKYLSENTFPNNTQAVQSVQKVFNLSEKEAKTAFLLYQSSTTYTNKLFYAVDENALILNDVIKVDGVTTRLENLDVLCFGYSSLGYNLPSTEVMKMVNLNKSEFDALKKGIGLTRRSFPIFMLESEDLTDVEERIKKCISYYEYVGEKSAKDSFYKSSISKLEKEQKIVTNKNIFTDIVVSSISSKLKENTDRKIPTSTRPSKRYVECSVILTDIHAGSRVEGLKNTLDYNEDIIISRFDQIVCELKELGYGSYNLFLLGDIIESVTGNNHVSTFHNLQFGKYLSESILSATDLLNDLISKIPVSNIYAVPGNHGRLTSSKHEDPYGDGEIIIYEILKRTNPNIEIQYDRKYVMTTIQGVDYYVFHGDKNFNKNLQYLILEEGKTTESDYSVFLQGHNHRWVVNADNKYYRHLTCPSIFTGNNWSDDMGMSISPGFMVIEHPANSKAIKTSHFNLD